MSELSLQVETFDAIKDLAERAANADRQLAIVPIPGHPTNNYYLVEENGKYDEVTPPLPPRKASIHCVDQVGNYALHVRDAWESEPAIYYSRNQVAIELADGSFEPDRGRTICPLVHTVAWETLEKWSNKPGDAWLKHSEFVRTLRIVLGDCFPDGRLDALSAQIGQLEFVNAERGRSQATRGHESMGYEVLNEIKAATGEIPEEVFLKVRVYRDPVLTAQHEIRCLLETDAVAGKLALIPAPGQMDRALDKELTDLGDLLRANVRAPKVLNGPDFFASASESANASAPKVLTLPWQIPVFYGTP